MLAGDLMTTGMIGLFFALFLLAFIWAWRQRQLQDVEQIKYEIFEDDDEAFTSELWLSQQSR